VLLHEGIQDGSQQDGFPGADLASEHDKSLFLGDAILEACQGFSDLRHHVEEARIRAHFKRRHAEAKEVSVHG